jgi:predicted histidine transporter YuiF (NhaC family)
VNLLGNAVFWGITVMLCLATLRMNVVISLLAGAIAAGFCAGFSISETLFIFNGGLRSGAAIAVSYSLLGAFACALAHSGLAARLLGSMLHFLDGNAGQSNFRRRSGLLLLLLAIALLSKSFLPVHVAFIPILLPPLLAPMARIGLDRRAVACTLAFGLVASYLILPIGFGHIFLREILQENLRSNGLSVSLGTILGALAIPFFGMGLGLLVAVFLSYGRPRSYGMGKILQLPLQQHPAPGRRQFFSACIALAVAATVQLGLGNSMVTGMLAGMLVFWISGAISSEKIDGIVGEGIRMMAVIGIIMVTASGFAAVLKASGGIEQLVALMVRSVHGSRSMAALLMLAIGFLISVGIGSSFATVPIVAALYVPFCAAVGFSPAATVVLVAMAAVPGDPASPASSSTLGPTSGLSADGQFNHMVDCVIPSFLHNSLPAIFFAWIAAMIL